MTLSADKTETSRSAERPPYKIIKVSLDIKGTIPNSIGFPNYNTTNCLNFQSDLGFLAKSI